MQNAARLDVFYVLQPFERHAFKGQVEQREQLDKRLDDSLKKYQDMRERQFITALCYGIARRWFQLNTVMVWGLDHFKTLNNALGESKIKQALKPLDVKSRLLLRLGLFQLLWMDSVPDYATIAETLEMADRLRLTPRSKKQLHAILSKSAERVQTLKAALQGVPLWPASFIQSLSPVFSAEQIDAMSEVCQHPPKGFWIRINTIKTGVADYLNTLKQAGIAFETSEQVPECIRILGDSGGFSGSPRQLPGFAEGALYVQDLSSALVTHWLDPKPGERILDVCAAPGSKTTHMAARIQTPSMQKLSIQEQESILAIESSDSRSVRLAENCSRLGVNCVEIINADVLSWEPVENAPPDKTLFDKVLVDAPCSGTGTMHHQPDVLVQWRASQTARYTETQLAILERASQWLSPTGVLLYSTCSLDPEENQSVVERFLSKHSGWRCQEQHRILISETQDGFYAALLTPPLQ